MPVFITKGLLKIFQKDKLKMVRVAGIGPASAAWKAAIIAIIRHSHGAPGRTRTCNNSSEDCHDIHFTTGAV